MSLLGRIFEKQLAHYVLLAVLLAATALVYHRHESFAAGSYLGINTPNWFWLSVAAPIIHQVWVWLCWRLELHQSWLSRHLGDTGFRIYAAGFALFSFLRFATLIPLASANRDTVQIDRGTLQVLALLAAVVCGYLFYSVIHYFGFRRALGIDHFDPSYKSATLVRKGIFRYTRNGMYTYGFLAVWLPGLIYGSSAALLSALFSHLYIWVHYLTTELPDMRRIYGEVADA